MTGQLRRVSAISCGIMAGYVNSIKRISLTWPFPSTPRRKKIKSKHSKALRVIAWRAVARRVFAWRIIAWPVIAWCVIAWCVIVWRVEARTRHLFCRILDQD